MKQKTITRLTESDLHQLIKESVKHIIKEYIGDDGEYGCDQYSDEMYDGLNDDELAQVHDWSTAMENDTPEHDAFQAELTQEEDDEMRDIFYDDMADDALSELKANRGCSDEPSYKTIILTEEQLLTMINESLSSQVYHWTSISTAYKILKTDRMFCQSSLATAADNKSRKYNFYISMTRNKTSYEGFAVKYNNNAARIELDGDLLNNNFAGKPVNYWGADDLLNKYTYTRRATGVKDGDNFQYMEINDLPQGAVASNRKEWMRYPTANSPEYIKVGNQYYHKENNKRNENKVIEFAYKPIANVPEGVEVTPFDSTSFNQKFEFKYPREYSPEYVSYDGQVYQKERVIPREIQQHQDNEIEDRLTTNKPYIDEISKYIKRIDIIINNFDELPDNTKRCVYKLAYSHKCFIYNNEKDFNAQSENVINKQIQDIEDGYDKYGKVLQDDRTGDIITPLSKFLYIITLSTPDKNEKNRIAGELLKQHKLTKYVRPILKQMNRLYGNIGMLMGELTSELQNLSKSPTENGQSALGLIGNVFRRRGYKNWEDFKTAIKTELNPKEHQYDNIDTTIKKTRKLLMINGYEEFDVTDDKDTDFWYIFDLNSKQSRYYFIENLLDNIKYSTGGNWETEGTWVNNVRDNDKVKFQKYLQNLAHKKVTLEQMFNIMKKIGYSPEQFFSDFGWSVEYKTETFDYWNYKWSNVVPPFKGKTYYRSDNRDEYANAIFKKDNNQ